MGKTEVKTEKASTAMAFIVFLISLYVLIMGIFTKVENPLLIAPFVPMFLLTCCKLCDIDIKKLKEIRIINLK